MGLEHCPMAWKKFGLWEILLAHEGVGVPLKKQLIWAVAHEHRYVPACGEMSASLLSGLGSLLECLVLRFPEDDACHFKSFRFCNCYVLTSLNRHGWKGEIFGSGSSIDINFRLVRLASAGAGWP